MKDKFKKLLENSKVKKDKVKYAIQLMIVEMKKETFIMDFIFILGSLIIIITNLIVNIIFGLYFLGISLILFSIFLNKTKKVR